MGLIRLTLNPTASLPEVSTANNSRDITSPNWVGADIEIIGGSLAVGGPGPYDPVVSNVRLKNLGNQRPQTMPGIIVLIVARVLALARLRPTRFTISSTNHSILERTMFTRLR
jgi:hypothetical protein